MATRTVLPAAAESAPAPVRPGVGRTRSSLSVFDTLEQTFRSLSQGPGALTLPGGLFSPGRCRPARLREARELLLWPGRMDLDDVDRVWAVVVRGAQGGDPAWVVAAAGLLLPGLRYVTAQLTAGYAGDYDDVATEVLIGFLTRLRSIDPDSGRLASRLRWAGYRGGLAERHRATDAIRRRAPGVEPSVPHRPWGHPDFVLAAAVRAGIVTVEDADLIGVTRLEGVELEDVAADLGISRRALIVRRNRAEHRLAESIRRGVLARSTVEARPLAAPDHARPETSSLTATAVTAAGTGAERLSDAGEAGESGDTTRRPAPRAESGREISADTCDRGPSDPGYQVSHSSAVTVVPSSGQSGRGSVGAA